MEEGTFDGIPRFPEGVSVVLRTHVALMAVRT